MTQAFDALVRAGKIRAIGLSNFTAVAVREWMRVAAGNGRIAPEVLQPHYSLAHRQPFEHDLAPVARAEAHLTRRGVSGASHHDDGGRIKWVASVNRSPPGARDGPARRLSVGGW